MDVVIDSWMEVRGRGLVVVVQGDGEWPAKGPAFYQDSQGIERTCLVTGVEGFSGVSTFGLVLGLVMPDGHDYDFVAGGTMRVAASGHKVRPFLGNEG
jgi:hypothetical protein